MTESTEALSRRVGSLNPEIGSMLNEHERFYKVLLPHVFFGEVSSWAIERSARPDLDPLLALLEQAYATDDQDVRDLIGASFLENIEDNATMVERLGPASRAAVHPY